MAYTCIIMHAAKNGVIQDFDRKSEISGSMLLSILVRAFRETLRNHMCGLIRNDKTKMFLSTDIPPIFSFQSFESKCFIFLPDFKCFQSLSLHKLSLSIIIKFGVFFCNLNDAAIIPIFISLRQLYTFEVNVEFSSNNCYKEPAAIFSSKYLRSDKKERKE